MTYSAPRPRKRRPLPWILGGLAVIVLLCAGFAILGTLTSGEEKSPAGEAATPAAATTKAKAPTAADVKLTAEVTEQTCYGEAGCAVTWRPKIIYTGPDTGGPWSFTYTVAGVESGTTKGTVVMSGSTPAKQNDKHARTASKDAKIMLKVTGVKVG